MRKILFSLGIIASSASWAQNAFLTNEYWKANPSPQQVAKDINEKNNPTALNDRAFDATTFAIMNNAPQKTIQYLIDIEGNGVDKLTHDKRTYLFWAAYQNNVPVMKYLLSKGAKVNIKESHQLTPLLFAAVGGQSNKAIYDLLLKNGASITDTNNEGASALLLLLPNLTDLKAANYFVKKGLKLEAVDNNGNNAIYYAATKGNKKVIDELIKKGIDVKAVNKKGENAFFAAARGAKRFTNKVDFYIYLEQLGLNPNQKNANGLTPLYVVAGKNSDVAVINYLLEKGNDPNQVNAEKGGRTPLMNAAALNSAEVVKLLAEKSQNINAVNSDGYSALTLAVDNNRAEVVRLLLDLKADASVVDNEGNTLYHHAVKRGDKKILELIAELGLPINVKNKEGVTPLQIAAMIAEDTDILQFLLSKGADKTITTDLGETAYDLAKENEKLHDKNIDFLK